MKKLLTLTIAISVLIQPLEIRAAQEKAQELPLGWIGLGSTAGGAALFYAGRKQKFGTKHVWPVQSKFKLKYSLEQLKDTVAFHTDGSQMKFVRTLFDKAKTNGAWGVMVEVKNRPYSPQDIVKPNWSGSLTQESSEQLAQSFSSWLRGYTGSAHAPKESLSRYSNIAHFKFTGEPKTVSSLWNKTAKWGGVGIALTGAGLLISRLATDDPPGVREINKREKNLKKLLLIQRTIRTMIIPANEGPSKLQTHSSVEVRLDSDEQDIWAQIKNDFSINASNFRSAPDIYELPTSFIKLREAFNETLNEMLTTNDGIYFDLQKLAEWAKNTEVSSTAWQQPVRFHK